MQVVIILNKKRKNTIVLCKAIHTGLAQGLSVTTHYLNVMFLELNIAKVIYVHCAGIEDIYLGKAGASILLKYSEISLRNKSGLLN